MLPEESKGLENFGTDLIATADALAGPRMAQQILASGVRNPSQLRTCRQTVANGTGMRPLELVLHVPLASGERRRWRTINFAASTYSPASSKSSRRK
jgi:hypothetical protein